MNQKIFNRTIFIVIFVLLSVMIYGQTGFDGETETEDPREPILMLMPNATVGYYSAMGNDDIKGLSYSYGLKILLPANELQRYGVLVDALTLTGKSGGNDDIIFLRTGIYVEQVLFRCFNMGIGTVGYINLTGSGTNPFGLYTHLGFEYPFAKHFFAAVLYQNEWIFASPVISNQAFMASVSVRF
ncbi:hypothetical protein FACS1894164_21450 [Spirochaetia bacterium]|nr:hypothetical protein FACS1894164_21450 [Spirochaetia bacterium]